MPASPLPVDLVWEAPAECPNAEAVLSEVARLVKRPRSSRIGVRAVVTRETSGQWSARLSTVTENGNGERRLEGESCEAVAKATALIVALAVDPDRALETKPIEPAPPPATASNETTPPRAPAKTPENPPNPAPPPGPAPHETRATPPPPPAPSASAGPPMWNAAIMVVGDVGTLPHAGPGLMADLGFGPSALRVELGGAIWATQKGFSGALPTAGGDFELLSAHAHGCFVPRAPTFSFGGCVGAELDHMSATGTGVDVQKSGSNDWLSVTASGLGVFHVARWLDVRGELGVVLPLTRPGFVIEGLDRVHKPSVIAGRVAFGLDVRF